MKGPFERLKYDGHRVWECPICHHKERATGEVTWRVCPCQQKEDPTKQRVMQLTDEGFRRIDGGPKPVASLVIEAPTVTTETATPMPPIEAPGE